MGYQRILPILIVVITLSFPATGSAQSKFARYLNGWHIFRSDNTCRAHSTINTSVGTHLAIQIDRTGLVELSFRNDAWKPERNGRINVTTRLGGKIYFFRPKPVLNHKVYIGGMATFIDQAAMKDMAKSQLIEIRFSDEEPKRLEIPELGNVLQTLKECGKTKASDFTNKWTKISLYEDDQKSTRIGQARHPLPQNSVDRWLNENDYPSRALKDQIGGSVAVLLTVNENGRVRECNVTKSSGQMNLDHAACKGFFRRSRFFPATDFNGLPVEGVFPLAVQFTPPPIHEPLILYEPEPAFMPED